MIRDFFIHPDYRPPEQPEGLRARLIDLVIPPVPFSMIGFLGGVGLGLYVESTLAQGIFGYGLTILLALLGKRIGREMDIRFKTRDRIEDIRRRWRMLYSGMVGSAEM